MKVPFILFALTRYLVMLMYYTIDEFLPRRCAIIGKTKVAFSFKMDANILMSEMSSFNSHEPGTGTIVGYVYEYVTEGRVEAPGIYLRNSKFPPGGFLVEMDATKTLVAVPLENAELTSGYSYAIKSLCQKMSRQSRIGDHKPPLVGKVCDIVRIADDPTNTERVITQIAFTPAGEARYYVSMTKDEVRAENLRREQKSKETGRPWSRIWTSATYRKVAHNQLIFVREGFINPNAIDFDSDLSPFTLT